MSRLARRATFRLALLLALALGGERLGLSFFYQALAAIDINQEASSLSSLLKEQKVSEAGKWLEDRYAEAIPTFTAVTELGSPSYALLVSPSLEAILAHMHSCRQLLDGSEWNFETGKSQSLADLDSFIFRYLDGSPFTATSLAKVEELAENTNALFSPEQWLQLRSYIVAGIIRNQLGALIARYDIPRIWSERGREKEFRKIIAYLNNKGEHFRELQAFGGLEQIFFVAHSLEGSLLEQAIKRRYLYELELLTFLLSPRLAALRDEQANNFLHLAINQGLNKPSYEAYDEETQLENILRFFLYSRRIAVPSLLQALRQKNAQHETPLLLTAKKGFYRCFKMLKTFLLEQNTYNQSEHCQTKNLYTHLLEGMIARYEALPQENIRLQALKDLLSHYPQLPVFKPVEPGQRRLLTPLFRELKALFQKPAADPVSEIYQPAFWRILEFFSDSPHCPGFMQAPLNQRMAYYEWPLRYLLRKLLQTYPQGLGDSHETFLWLAAPKLSAIDPFFEEAIKSLIASELEGRR